MGFKALRMVESGKLGIEKGTGETGGQFIVNCAQHLNPVPTFLTAFLVEEAEQLQMVAFHRHLRLLKPNPN